MLILLVYLTYRGNRVQFHRPSGRLTFQEEKLMEFTELIENRFSARTFTSVDVDESAVDAILEAVLSAPSAGNRQAYKVVVVRDEKAKLLLADASGPQGWVAKAPVVFVFFSDIDIHTKSYGESKAAAIPSLDSTIAMAFAQLAATDLGLGSCWVAPFAHEQAQEICGLDGNLALAGLLPVGHTTEGRPKRKRRKSSEWSVKI